jgi:L-threonylcarbamoyladenylate synthase
LLAAGVDALVAAVPELDGDRLASLLPGPYTLVLPNPAGRFPWLTGGAPGPIGVRVPELPEPARTVVAAAGVVLATSANDPGGANPSSLDDVPARIRAGCGAEIDAGRLPGTPSTVLDLSGPEPRVLREGAVPAAEALARLGA